MISRLSKLESEIAWLRYGPERMNLALRERNAVWMNRAEEQPSESGEDKEEDARTDYGEESEEDDDKPEEFKHVIVCGCKQCMASHRFGDAEADNIFSTFDDDEERECIVKKCLKYHCWRLGLVCIVQKEGAGSLCECHIALVEAKDGKRWRVVYGGMLVNGKPLHENPAFDGLCRVFKTIGCMDGCGLLEISWTPDRGGFSTDEHETDYVAQARKRGFMTEGGETGAEFKARRSREQGEQE
jgi:hypothetical protein